MQYELKIWKYGGYADISTKMSVPGNTKKGPQQKLRSL